MAFWRQDPDGLVLDVQVVPRSSRERLGPPLAGADRLKVQLTAPPVEGAANEALVAFVAKSLGVPRRQVSIAHGEHGRKKTLRVAGDGAAIRAALAAALGGRLE